MALPFAVGVLLLLKLLWLTLLQLVTPIGIAIGVSVHQVYNVNGRAGLLASGILDSLSAGILL